MRQATQRRFKRRKRQPERPEPTRVDDPLGVSRDDLAAIHGGPSWKMPTRPKRPCPEPTCPNLDCAEHSVGKRYNRSRGTSSQRGYDSAWSRFAKVYRIETHPLCAACQREGRTAVTEQVDHIIPLSVWKGDMYDESNLQPLCGPCHTRKTVAEAKDRSGRGYLIDSPLVP